MLGAPGAHRANVPSEAVLWVEVWRHAWTIYALKVVQWMQATVEYYKNQKATPWDMSKRDIRETQKKWTR